MPRYWPVAGHRRNFPQGRGTGYLPSDSRHYPLINLPPQSFVSLLTVCLVCLESLVSLPRKPRLSPDYCLALIHLSLLTLLTLLTLVSHHHDQH